MITNLGVKHFYGNRNINSWLYQHRGLTGKAKYTKRSQPHMWGKTDCMVECNIHESLYINCEFQGSQDKGSDSRTGPIQQYNVNVLTPKISSLLPYIYLKNLMHDSYVYLKFIVPVTRVQALERGFYIWQYSKNISKS